MQLANYIYLTNYNAHIISHASCEGIHIVLEKFIFLAVNDYLHAHV